MKRNIKLVAAALLLGTQTLAGSLRVPTGGYPNSLNASDLERYNSMLELLQQSALRNVQRQRVTVFFLKLNVIRRFIEEGDPAWKLDRELVCGLIWKDLFVAKHTGRLAKVLGGSKSSVNQGFRGLGYGSVRHSDEQFLEIFPELDALPWGDRRQWVMLSVPRIEWRNLNLTVVPSMSSPGRGAGDALGESEFDFPKISPEREAGDNP
jgi:hypothetical protein